MQTQKGKYLGWLSLAAICFFSVTMPQRASASASPDITTQPQSQSLLAGTNATFNVVASGQGTLIYQWLLNETNLTDSARVSGATQSTLIISNLVASDAGDYQVNVSNSHGSVISSNATLTVLFPPSFISQPANQDVVLSSNVSFAATASGTEPLRYQWQKNGINLIDSGPVSGSTTTNLTIANAQTNDAGSYQLIVTNDYGSVTGAVAVLSILVPAAIASEPSSQSVLLNSNAVFSASASGTLPLRFQWYFNGAPLADNGHVSGSTSTNLTITSVQTNDAGSYQLVVTNDYGSASSSPATLTILVPATITGQPTNQSVVLNSNASFTVTATGTGPLNYQWQFKGTNLADSGHISGTTTATLNIANAQTNDVGSYQVTVTNNYGAISSAAATLTILVPPSIVSSPTNRRVLVGGNVSFSVTVVGTQPLSYQWQKDGTNLTDEGSISGSTHSTMTITNLQFSDDGAYDVVVSNAYGVDVSTAATLNVATNLPPISSSIGVWGDFDNDGLMDVLLAGDVQGVAGIPDGRFTRLYHNAGGGIFDDTGVKLPQLDNVSAAWGDFDNNGHLDLLLSGLADGTNGPVSETVVYRNDGSNHFTQLNLGLEPAAEGSVAWVDYDNDGHPDIFVTGYDTTTSNWVTQIYHNNGDDTFTLAVTNLPALANNHGYWGDYDNDGTPDLLLSGSGTTYLLHNDGGGNFSNSGLSVPAQNAVVSPWCDYDGDGRLDFITSSATIPSVVYGPDYHPTFYHNEGNGGFSTHLDNSLDMWLFNARWGDVDNSGRACVVVSGWVPLVSGGGVWGSATKVYHYSGGSWQEVFTLGGWDSFPERWVDYNGDGALDIFTTGGGLTTFWNNNIATHRDFPQPPSNPVVAFTGLDGVLFSWQSPSNTPTTGRGLSYNVRVGHTPGCVDVVSPMSNPATGQRLIPALGNAGAAHLFVLTNLPPGNYYWAVQTLGQSYTGSPFTTEGMFVVTSSPPVIVSEPTNLTVPWSSNVTVKVTSIGTKPLAYQWHKDGLALSDDASHRGSTSPSLSITNVQESDAGTYTVIITNDYGAITSSVAALTVLLPLPVITMQPANAGAFLGQSVSFSVNAKSDTPLGYQWLFNGIPLSYSDHLDGAESNQLTILNVQGGDFGGYQVMITNAWGAITSAVANLTIATTRYVNVNNLSPLPPYTNWASAATAIQDAIDAANVDDVILVTNGIYQTGGRTVNGSTLTNRVVIDKPVIVQSVNGPAVTVIKGYPVLGNNAVRCVYMTNSAMLDGFNLEQGSTLEVSWATVTNSNSGAGAWCASPSEIITNCWIQKNSAYMDGGGVHGGTLLSCILSNNYAPATAGASYCFLTNCTCVNNQGVGANYSLLNNCSLIGNSGGGAYDCTLIKCNIATNTASWGAGAIFSTLQDCYVIGNSCSYAGAGLENCNASNCVINGNSVIVQTTGPSGAYGGGAYDCILSHCVISGNWATNSYNDSRPASGGGVYGGSLDNCVVYKNYSGNNLTYWAYGGGGGVCGATINNSTVVGNISFAYGGGVYNCNCTNSIVINNTAYYYYGSSTSNYYGGTFSYCCVSPFTAGQGNISDAPVFLDPQNDNFHLKTNSPCVNAGNNAYATVPNDLDDNPRIVGGTVDMGAYECQIPLYFLHSPTNQDVLTGNNIVLNAFAVGDQPAYQWWFNGTLLSDGGRILGAESNSLTVLLSQTNDTGNYWVTASNSDGIVTSEVATVTVFQQPVTITAQPTNETVLAGSNVSFTVGATGVVPPNYLWYSKGTVLADSGRISGAATATLTISDVQANDSADYQVVVTNNYGSVTSQVATLTVLTPVQITGQPSSQSVLLGSNAMFAINAIGSGPLGYQWYFNGSPLADGGHISGSGGPILNITNVQSSDAGGYVAVVTNLLSSAKSLTASLTPQATLSPSVRYVDLECANPQSPYLTWTNAATNIQDAIDAAVAGDLVLVTNGVYVTGGRPVYGTVTNRIAVDKAVTVQSVNGPESTAIQEFNHLPVAFFPGRCAYLTNGATLSGFTLSNGGANSTGDLVQEQSGGGVWCESASVIVSNCVFSGNYAPRYGGGAFGGTLINCILTNNSASFGGGAASNTLYNCTLAENKSAVGQNLNMGGGAFGAFLSHCLLVGNQSLYGGAAAMSYTTDCAISNNIANYGGGVSMGIANDSIISSNRAYTYGGGAYSNVLNNCVLKNNQGGRTGGGAYNSTLTSCTVVSNSAAGGGGINNGSVANSIVYDNVGGNIFDTKAMFNVCSFPYIDASGVTNEPLFVNEANGDFHLASNSPCINSGNNAYVSGTNDLDGNPRIVGGTVDMGAYEYQSPASVISYAWLQQYGLPTDGSVDYTNLNGTGFSVYQDWIAGLNPTNPASVLALQTPATTNNSAGITVTWQSVNTRTYYLQRSSDLTQPFSTIQSNLIGHTGTTSYLDTSATNDGPYFYRVGVQ